MNVIFVLTLEYVFVQMVGCGDSSSVVISLVESILMLGSIVFYQNCI